MRGQGYYQEIHFLAIPDDAFQRAAVSILA
jgi:hypothetical protein